MYHLVVMKELSLLPCSEAFDEEYNSTDHHPPCGNDLFHFHKAPEKTSGTERAVHLATHVSQTNPVLGRINAGNQFVLISLLS